MRIAKSRVVNLFILLGCPKAAKWNDEILAGRVATMHEVFDLEMQVDKKYQPLFEKIYKASKENLAIDIIDDSHNPVESLLRNVDTDLRMKPIEQPTDDKPVQQAISDSVVTIVPDVDENVDENDELDDEISNDEISNDEIDVDIDSTKQETKIVSKSKIQKDDIPTTGVTQSSVTEQSAVLPVYKSKFGKPQQVRRPLFNFELLDIPVGAKLYFTKDPSKIAVVHNRKKVIFEEMFGEEPVALTSLTRQLLDLPRDIQPTGFWLYEGVTLKKLYYDKFSDDSVTTPKPSKPNKQQSIHQKLSIELFDWDMNIDAMNLEERCLISDTLTVGEIAKLTNLSELKVRQFLIPLVRYGLVTQNENGTFTRLTESTQNAVS
ncbi:MAG: hypothetical protein LBG58_13175 [Planctomycetaceae bacterium]|jgi:hypothetical protein|nr:hypothetical protein [Planctomycetaceae bacterium]